MFMSDKLDVYAPFCLQRPTQNLHVFAINSALLHLCLHEVLLWIIVLKLHYLRQRQWVCGMLEYWRCDVHLVEEGVTWARWYRRGMPIKPTFALNQRSLIDSERWSGHMSLSVCQKLVYRHLFQALLRGFAAPHTHNDLMHSFFTTVSSVLLNSNANVGRSFASELSSLCSCWRRSRSSVCRVCVLMLCSVRVYVVRAAVW